MNARLRLPVLIGVVAIVALACAPEDNQPAFTGDISKGNPPAEEAAASTADGTAPDPVDLTDVQSDELQAALDQTPPGC